QVREDEALVGPRAGLAEELLRGVVVVAGVGDLALEDGEQAQAVVGAALAAEVAGLAGEEQRVAEVAAAGAQVPLVAVDRGAAEERARPEGGLAGDGDGERDVQPLQVAGVGAGDLEDRVEGEEGPQGDLRGLCGGWGGGEGAEEDGGEVVGFELEAVEGLEAGVVFELGGQLLAVLEEVGGVAGLGEGAVAHLGEAVVGVLADGVEEGEAVLARELGEVGAGEERAVAEGLEDVQGGHLRTEDRLDGLEGEAAAEDGAAREGLLVALGEEAPGPADGALQGALALLALDGAGGDALGVGEEDEARGEAGLELLDGEVPHAGGGQLDGEREAVQLADDGGEVGGLEVEARAGAAGALDEELDGFGVEGVLVAVGERHGAQLVDLAVEEGEGLAGGDEEAGLRAELQPAAEG